MRPRTVLALFLLLGCGDDSAPIDASAADGFAALDGSANDGSTGDDGGALDGSALDASASDGSVGDGSVGDGGAADGGPGVDAAPGPDAGPSAACDGSVGSRNREIRVTSDGMMRTFQVHIPTAYDGTTPLPLVLNFHGRGSTSTQQNLVSGMNGFSDGAGFIAVHPDGIGNTWNGGLCCGEAMTRNIDDVAFTEAMINALVTELCVDERRIYATGLSNGGFMSHRLACELSDRIAAIAPVAGTNVTSSCSPSRAMPVLHFHGTADLIVPYEGFVGVASVADTMSGWATRNGCASTSTTTSTRGDVTCEEWAGCRDGAAVRLCSVAGGGHQWPGGFTVPGLGYNTDDVSATEEMWSFFLLHSL